MASLASALESHAELSHLLVVTENLQRYQKN